MHDISFERGTVNESCIFIDIQCTISSNCKDGTNRSSAISKQRWTHFHCRSIVHIKESCINIRRRLIKEVLILIIDCYIIDFSIRTNQCDTMINNLGYIVQETSVSNFNIWVLNIHHIGGCSVVDEEWIFNLLKSIKIILNVDSWGFICIILLKSAVLTGKICVTFCVYSCWFKCLIS